MTRAELAAYWAIPPLFCLALYWYGLWTWFQQDDFVWLALRSEIHSWRDLGHALFTPSRHGTLRVLGERIYFIALSSWFGLDALPFRIVAFVTQFANLVLISSIARRVTGSRIAGFWAPVLWTANTSLSVVMAWSSEYILILCGFCILLAFHLLLRYIETDNARYYWAQWAVFLVGFGAMETNVVYPALAASYTFLFARRYLRKTLPLFAVSVLFVAFHMAWAPKQASGLYTLQFDRNLPATLWKYWVLALAPTQLAAFTGVSKRVETYCVVLLTAALIGFTLWMWKRRQWLPLFFLSWFVIVLSPVLPLRDHVTKYYLTLPAIGLAMLGAHAISCAWAARFRWKAIAVGCAAVYLLTAIPVDRASTQWWYRRGQSARKLVMGVAKARELHPGKTILLDGVDEYLFWAAVFDHGFKAIGIHDVYLTPGSERRLPLTSQSINLAEYVAPQETVTQGLKQEKVAIYKVGGERLKNITRTYEELESSRMLAETPRRVDVGNPLSSYLLGSGWYSLEQGYRWMSKRASLQIGGPRTASGKLDLTGSLTAAQTQQGPLEILVSVDNNPLAPAAIAAKRGMFELTLTLPPGLAGKPKVEVSVEVSRTIQPEGPGSRELGLSFGVFEIRD